MSQGGGIRGRREKPSGRSAGEKEKKGRRSIPHRAGGEGRRAREKNARAQARGGRKPHERIQIRKEKKEGDPDPVS